MLEDILSQSWGEASAGKIGGIRRTNWCSSLCASLDQSYDLAFFDIGPSLGSLNRSVLLGTQHFVSPVGADLFSIYGIRNIAEWLGHWLKEYKVGLGLAENNAPGSLEQFGISPDLAIQNGFAGYTVQQYIAKSKAGVRRATKAYEKLLQGIPEEIHESLGGFYSQDVDEVSVHLGDVPHMYSLVPLAQSVNAPIRELSSSDGLVGSQYKQAEKYANNLDVIVGKLAANIKYSGEECQLIRGHLTAELVERRCIVFMGAGVSMGSVASDGKSRPPGWDVFLKNALPLVTRRSDKKFAKDLVERGQFLDAAEVITECSDHAEFSDYLRHTFVTPRFAASEMHKAILELILKLLSQRIMTRFMITTATQVRRKAAII